MAHARATLGRADWSEAEIARAKRRAYARFNRAWGWESPRAAVGTSRARTNAAAPKTDAQVGLNGDFSRTMAFGEMRRSEAEGRLPKATAKPPARARGGGVLKCDCKPRKSAFPSLSFRFPFAAAAQPTLHHLSTTAPHRPPPLSLSLSFLSRFSTHDPTPRR